MPNLCHHCDDAPCIGHCKAEAIYKRDDGMVIIDPDEWQVPRCVDQCPTEVIRFGEEEHFADFIAEAEPYRTEAGTKSRVYYKGLPQNFVAGTVYEPNEKEVIIGATCTLKDDESGETYTETTDNFGDFWLKGLKENKVYTLTIEKDGFSKVIPQITTNIAKGLGDIPMSMQS